jgi:hypothetical protein
MSAAAQRLQGAPWRAGAASTRARTDHELENEILLLVKAHQGLTQLDVELHVDGIGETRATRLLSKLVEQERLERWRDENLPERPWRYWLIKERPPFPAPYAPITPPTAPDSTSAEVSAAPDEDEAPAETVTQKILAFFKAHPGGTQRHLEREHPTARVDGPLKELLRKGLLVRRQTGGGFGGGEARYFLAGEEPTRAAPKDDPPAPAPAPPPAAAPASSSAPAVAGPQSAEPPKRKPGPAPRDRPAQVENVSARVRELLQAAGDQGVSTQQLGDELGRGGQTVASQFVKSGEARREGRGRGSRYIWTGERLAPPPPADALREIEAAVVDIRALERALSDARARLQRAAARVAGGAA